MTAGWPTLFDGLAAHFVTAVFLVAVTALVFFVGFRVGQHHPLKCDEIVRDSATNQLICERAAR